jgi:hypothetical protein
MENEYYKNKFLSQLLSFYKDQLDNYFKKDEINREYHNTTLVTNILSHMNEKVENLERQKK